MTAHGKYNPENLIHTSSMWRYGEVPVASAKLNCWNGNIKDALDLINNLATLLFGGISGDFILDEGTGTELQVVAQDPPGLAVNVMPGFAIVSRCFAGIDTVQAIPDANPFVPPTSNSRIDILVMSQEGTITVIGGTESANPAVPATPAMTMKLAEIVHRVGETSIKDADDGVNGYIIDTRPEFLCGRSHRHNTDRTPPEVPDGNRTQFSTLEKFVAGTLEVYVNGVMQALGSSTVEPDGDQHGYTFADPPPADYVLEHRYQVAQS